MTTMTLTLRYGKGYLGALGNRCWVAEITGSDKTYGLQRTFLKPTSVEREHFHRPRTIINFSYELVVDRLYEISAEGDRWFEMCYPTAEGEIKTARVSDDRVKAWVAALDAGKTNREARLASKGL
jgi:hypothetical protein